MVGDQSILGSINKRLDGIDNLFDGKLREEIKIMEEKLQQSEQTLKEEKLENEKSRKLL